VLDETHAPDLASWVPSAQAAGTDFPIQNLPFGIFSRRGANDGRVGVAIGDQILDVAACAGLGLFREDAAVAAGTCGEPGLDLLMALGRRGARALRRGISALLRADALPHVRESAARALVPMRDAELGVPARIGDYTDFYASIHHATNVGRMFRPDNPLLPNYKWIPIGYHGRASSIVASGTTVRRPVGQSRAAADEPPTVGPTRRLDYEIEIGAFIGEGNALGVPIPIDEAEAHVFGLGLVNDWSARDIQAWEYQPLGPFLGKSFATTVSPWVVTLDALEPYRVPAAARPAGDPSPLPYLASADAAARGGFGIALEVLLSTTYMRTDGHAPFVVSRGSFADMYWTVAQLVAHHASNGCNLRPGDLLASGTVSGADAGSRGCLLERTWQGTEPLHLPTGETRTFLEDGDEVIMRAWCDAPGRARIGFGECRGLIGAIGL
jgi:fumarylacetoacetase